MLFSNPTKRCPRSAMRYSWGHQRKLAVIHPPLRFLDAQLGLLDPGPLRGDPRLVHQDVVAHPQVPLLGGETVPGELLVEFLPASDFRQADLGELELRLLRLELEFQDLDLLAGLIDLLVECWIDLPACAGLILLRGFHRLRRRLLGGHQAGNDEPRRE
jgi:hypothetical protein